MKKFRGFRVLSLVMGLILLMSITISGCGNKSEDDSAKVTDKVAEATVAATEPAEKAKIKVQWIGEFKLEKSTDAISGKEKLGVSVLETEFEKINPNIDVEFILMGWDDYQKKTQTMLMANEADVYQVPGIANLAVQGLLEPLQPLIDRDNFNLDIYIDGQVDGWKVVGEKDDTVQIYGLPMIGDTRFIVYDKNMFDDWGVEYLSDNPTPEEIKEKAQKMTGKNPKTDKQNYGLFLKGADAADTAMNLNEAFGGTWGSGDRMNELKLNFNTDTMVKAVDYVKDIINLAPEGTMAGQGGEKFGTKENDIAINLRANPNVIYGIETLGLSEQYGIARLFINEKEGMGGMFAGSPIAIGASSKNKDAAWEYIKFTASETFAKYFWENQRTEGLPVVKSAFEFNNIKANKNVELLMGSMQYLWTPRYIYRASQPRYILTDAVQAVLSKGEDTKAALDTAQKQAEEWVKQQ